MQESSIEMYCFVPVYIVVNIATWDMTIRLENSQVYVFFK